jgi:hypothetical protein
MLFNFIIVFCLNRRFKYSNSFNLIQLNLDALFLIISSLKFPGEARLLYIND